MCEHSLSGESIAPSGPVRGVGFGPRSAKSPGHNALAQTHKQGYMYILFH